MNASYRALIVIVGTMIVAGTTACAQDLDLGSTLTGFDAGADAGADAQNLDGTTQDASVDQGRPLPVDPIGGVSIIDIGSGHACAISRGQLYCWGANEFGELGLGDGAMRRAASRVGTESDWVDVELTADSTCAVKSGGRLYCWGRNNLGQVGDGTRVDRTVPTSIDFSGRVTSLDGVDDHFCAINDSAELWCWGDNRESNIGQGENEISGERDFAQPTKVTVDAGIGWLAVGAGDGHTCALRTDNVVMCWGRNTQGMAGGPPQFMQIVDPIEIANPPPAKDWLTVRTGAYNSCMRATNDDWYCLGNAGGERLPGLDADAFEPTAIDVPSGGELIMGTFHNCRLNEVGELFCWGLNLDGLLTATDIGESLSPRQIAQELGPVEGVGLGRFNTCVIVSGGDLYCRGLNSSGTVGANAPLGDVTEWRQVGQLREERR